MTLFDMSEGSAPLSGPLVRARMTVAYDGSGFHGFAPNAGVRTVGGTLQEAIRKVTRSPVELTCAGRTDTGVHAWGQVVSFDLPADRFDPGALARSLNRLLSPAIVVREMGPAPEGFDARRSAVGRTYRYTIVNRPVADPFLARVAWHVAEPLAIELLRLGCDPVIGEHDFSAFCRKPKQRDREAAEASLVRNVRRAGWTDLGDGALRFEIEADAFCHQMIRSLVGTLVEVGMARKHAGELLGILAGRDRSKASVLAPPHGLCLWAVSYPDEDPG
jgi:tRNA pseudouridine38-40 synthase